MFSQFRSKDKADEGKDKNGKDLGKAKDEKSDTKGQNNNKDGKQQTKAGANKQVIQTISMDQLHVGYGLKTKIKENTPI